MPTVGHGSAVLLSILKLQTRQENTLESIEERVRDFISENFPAAQDGEQYSSSQSLIETGVIDSIGVLTLVTWLEQEFEIIVDDEDVVPDNLDSINSLVSYVNRKREESGAA